MEVKNIYQRMAGVTAEIATVAKNLTVGTGRSQYKAVGEKDVLDAVKPLETKHGIYSYPVSSEILETDTLISAGYDGKEVRRFFLRLRVVYRFVNIDKPDEYVEITSFGDGIDSGDKATGKAMTYAGKYALLKAYKIATGDDPDQDPSPEQGYGGYRSSSRPACAECGKIIADGKKRSGETWAAADISTYARKMYGKPMCYNCLAKASRAAQDGG